MSKPCDYNLRPHATTVLQHQSCTRRECQDKIMTAIARKMQLLSIVLQPLSRSGFGPIAGISNIYRRIYTRIAVYLSSTPS